MDLCTSSSRATIDVIIFLMLWRRIASRFEASARALWMASSSVLPPLLRFSVYNYVNFDISNYAIISLVWFNAFTVVALEIFKCNLFKQPTYYLINSCTDSNFSKASYSLILPNAFENPSSLYTMSFKYILNYANSFYRSSQLSIFLSSYLSSLLLSWRAISNVMLASSIILLCFMLVCAFRVPTCSRKHYTKSKYMLNIVSRILISRVCVNSVDWLTALSRYSCFVFRSSIFP